MSHRIEPIEQTVGTHGLSDHPPETIDMLPDRAGVVQPDVRLDEPPSRPVAAPEALQSEPAAPIDALAPIDSTPATPVTSPEAIDAQPAAPFSPPEPIDWSPAASVTSPNMPSPTPPESPLFYNPSRIVMRDRPTTRDTYYVD